jgi:hypothetical protein
MGYRHIMISDTMIPRENQLPDWFKDKYEGVIDFSGDYWRTYGEYKRYMTLSDIEEDTQRVIKELDCTSIRLVFFADESEPEFPDISHVYITNTEITEGTWGDMQMNTSKLKEDPSKCNIYGDPKLIKKLKDSGKI